MRKERGKEQTEIIAINVFKNGEEERKNIFVDAMARTIARSEKNLKTVKFENKITN